MIIRAYGVPQGILQPVSGSGNKEVTFPLWGERPDYLPLPCGVKQGTIVPGGPQW